MRRLTSKAAGRQPKGALVDASTASIIDFSLWKRASELFAVASAVGTDKPFAHYYQAALEFEKDKADKLLSVKPPKGQD